MENLYTETEFVLYGMPTHQGNMSSLLGTASAPFLVEVRLIFNAFNHFILIFS